MVGDDGLQTSRSTLTIRVLGDRESECLQRRRVGSYSSGGEVYFGLAHGEAPPHPGPLVTIGPMSVQGEGGGSYEPFSTFANLLVLSERSRNEPAFQSEMQAREVIKRTFERLDPHADRYGVEIQVDGSRLEFQKCEPGEDWVAFRQIGDEYLWLHVEQPDGSPISIVTTYDITAYLPIDESDV